MKKIVLSLAGVMAAVAFAPEASAVPVFARQTGMACSACHYQHFPLLNGFGRSFKASGFTLMGAQGKVEDEHLSIPDRVNMGVLATTFMQFQSNNNLAAAPVNKWGVPGSGGELSLFFGGKISEFAGFLSEIGLNGGTAGGVAGVGGATGIGAAKLPVLVEVADNTRAGLVIHSSGGQGVAYSFELLNTGAANTHKLMGNSGPAGQHVKAFSASQYLGTNTAATGISLVAVNPDMGFINVGKYAPAGINAGANAGANTLPLTYIRAAGMFDVAGFDSAVGIQNFSGNATALGIAASHKATIVDGQMQGEMGGMPVGFYASYGTAPTDAVNANAFAAGLTGTAKSFNVAGEVGVLPGHATLQLAYRNAKTPAGLADNAIMVGGVYDIAMNVALTLHYTTQSGSAWNAANAVGKTATTLLLETLF